MYMKQRQELFVKPGTMPTWYNVGDVEEADLDDILGLNQHGATVSDDPNDRDTIIVTGPSRRVRHVIISETQRQAWELYYALNGR